MDRRDLFFVQPYSDAYIQDSINMLYAKRVNSFLFTYNTTLHIMRSMGVEDEVRSAGCVSNANVYLAFSPDQRVATEVADMKAFFDATMTRFKADGGVAKIMKHYELSDWSVAEHPAEHHTD